MKNMNNDIRNLTKMNIFLKIKKLTNLTAEQ